jgi:hypothetical protein
LIPWDCERVLFVASCLLEFFCDVKRSHGMSFILAVHVIIIIVLFSIGGGASELVGKAAAARDVVWRGGDAVRGVACVAWRCWCQG